MPSRVWRWMRAAMVAAVVACFVATLAQAATLRGRVVSRETGRPIEGALVRLIEAGRAQRSGPDGVFTFVSLAPGVYTLGTHHVAYADEALGVRVHDGDADSVAIALRAAVYQADQVVVLSDHAASALHRSPWAAGLRTSGQLAAHAAVTLSEQAATIPGVALVRDGTWQTAVSIRGMSRSNIVSLVDGVRIETANDLAGALSLVSDADLERVEVMKSPGSVLFGSGCLGGTIQMITRRAAFADRAAWGGEWSERATSVDHGLAHHLALEHSTTRTALRVSAGYRDADDTRTSRGEIPNSQYTDWNLSGSLGVRTSGEQSLFASWQRVQAEDTGVPGGAAIAATATATYRLARRRMFALEYAIPNLARALPLVTLRASHQEIARNVEIVQSPTVLVTPHATHGTASFQLESRIVPGAHHLLVAGAELWQRELDSRRERWLKATGRYIGERPVPRSAFGSAGLYAQDDWDVLADRMRLVLGARYDWSRTRNDRTLNPEYVFVNGVLQQPTPGQVVLWPAGRVHDASWNTSAGLHVQLSRAIATRLLAATAFRSPSLEERFQYLDLGTSLHVGNPGLRPERSVSLNAGARLQAGRTTLDADAFLNTLTDLVTESAGSFLGRSAWVKTNVGRARLYGFELSAEQRLFARSALSASLALVRGEDTGRHTPLAQIAPLTGRMELSTDAGAAGTLSAGLAAAHAQDSPGPDEARTSGWTTWHARYESASVPALGAAWRVRAGVDNLFDRAYREHLSTLRGLVQLEPGRGWHLSLGAAF